MAELNYEYTTTYKAGDNVEIKYTWMLLTGLNTSVNIYNENGNKESHTLEEFGVYNDYHIVQLITDMKISGSGDMYDSASDFVFKSSTEEDTNINMSGNTFPQVFIWRYSTYQYRIVGIEEIICSNLITSFADGLFSQGLYNLQTAPFSDGMVYARKLVTPTSLQRTGKYNYVENNYKTFSKKWIHDVQIDCTNLVNIGKDTFVDGVIITGKFNSVIEVIHAYGFNNYSVKVLDLGTINYISDCAFYECPNLETFNENNYLNNGVEGTPFYNCPCIKKLTLGDNVKHIDTNGEDSVKPFIYVEVGTGNNLYDGTDSKYTGWQMVEVITNKREFLEYWYDAEYYGKYIGTNWDAGYIYVGAVIEDGEEFWCFQAGRTPADIIRIKAYDSGDRAFQCGNKIKYIRYVELSDPKASPIHCAIGNKVMALSY